jgi:acetyltransferase-like isoleucine patch superfamily enzyme
VAAHIAALPFLVCHAFKRLFLDRNRALEGSTQLLSLWPGLSGQYVRRAFLSWTIAECHPSASIGFGTIFSKADARIGANVYVGPYCSVGSVTIEKDVLVATGSHLVSGGRIHGTSDPDVPIREQPGEIVHIRLGAGCWIGAGAIVMADVGAGSIVGAGAVVTQPIPDSVIAAGVPARVIRPRFSDPPKE